MGYLMWPIYLLTQSFGWSIIIFTLLIKLAMLPLTLKQQKNMAVSQLFAPKVREIQQKYRNNREKMSEELVKLQQEGYNPAGGCGPMLLTMLILFGMIDVAYKPMTHMEHMPSTDISSAVTVAEETEIASVLLNEYNAQDLAVVNDYIGGNTDAAFITDENGQLVHEYASDEGFTGSFNEKDPAAITADDAAKYGEPFVLQEAASSDLLGSNSRLTNETKQKISQVKTRYTGLQKELIALQMYNKYPDTFMSSSRISDGLKDQIANLSKNMMFMGLDFEETPRFAFEPLLLIPVLSFLLSLGSNILSQYLNKKNNPEAADAPGMTGMKLFLYIMPLFSLWIAFSVPAGVGFYWIVNYVFSILQTILMQIFYSPDKIRAKAEAEFNAKHPKPSNKVTTTAVVTDARTGEKKKITKEEMLSQKEMNRRKLAAARKADAEKYGEEYDDSDDE